MLDALKRMALMGVGVLATAEHEVENVVAELRKKGELSEEEGKKLLSSLRERIALNKREVADMAQKAAQEALQKVGAPTREEFDALAARVAALEAKHGSEPG